MMDRPYLIILLTVTVPIAVCTAIGLQFAMTLSKFILLFLFIVGMFAAVRVFERLVKALYKKLRSIYATPPFRLLDLPTELFELVIDEYIASATYNEVWAARQTCCKFFFCLPIFSTNTRLATFRNSLVHKILTLKPFEQVHPTHAAYLARLLSHVPAFEPESRFRAVWYRNKLFIQFLLRWSPLYGYEHAPEKALMRDLKKHNEPYGVQLRAGTGVYKGKDGSLMSVVCVFRLGTRAIVKEEVMVRWKVWEMIEEGSDSLSVLGWGKR
jgi:hypothetical protein